MTVREQIIEGACVLLERRGYHAVSLNDIVKESGAPKGSVYYYFPAGKDQIISEAVLHAGQTLVESLRTELNRYSDPVQAVYGYILSVAENIEQQQFTGGYPLTSISSEAAGSSDQISKACRTVYSQLRAVLQEKIGTSGLGADRGYAAASLVLANVEGGIILSRVYRSADPLRLLAGQLRNILQNTIRSYADRTQGELL